MRSRRWGYFALAVASATVANGLFGLGVEGAGAQDKNDLEGRAKEKVAREQGIPAGSLSIVERASAKGEFSKKETVDFKVQAQDGRTFGVSFDKGSKDEVDGEKARADETKARFDAIGKQDKQLKDRFDQHGNSAKEPVAFWLTMEDVGELGRQPGGVEAIQAKVRAVQEPVAAAIRAAGGEPELADGVPVVFATVNHGQAKAIEALGEVAAVHYASPDNMSMIDDSATANRYPYSWGAASGTGVKVAVHEDDGVDNVNPFLNNATHPVTYWDSVNKNIGGHATNVAGVMASTNQWRRGGAFNTPGILSANFQSYGSTANIVNSAVWAASNGAGVINMSWGGCPNGAPNFYSRWVDYMQKVYTANIVISSGNIPNCGGSTYVASPGLAWNPISVGSYWDKNTGLRSDDALSSFTEWRNPTDPNSGRTYEKPDLTAAGGEVINGVCQGVNTTPVNNGVGASTCGTSFSSPDAAALAADVRQRINNGSSPEAVKAILMASATHNIIDGFGYRDCPASPVAYDCRDGAGAIDAYQAIYGVAGPGRWKQQYITAASNPTGSNLDTQVSLTAGAKVRVAIAWDSTATCANAAGGNCATDVLNADLDLSVLNPSNAVVASSASYQNSAEVVDFTAPVSGVYTFRTNMYRFDANTTTFLGTAWNINTTDIITPLTNVTPVTLNTTLAHQTTDKGTSYWDAYTLAPGGASGCTSFLAAETGLQKVYRIQTPSTGKVTATLSSIGGFSGVNSDIDVILLKATGAPDAQNAQTLNCGDTALSSPNLPAGWYYVVVDGHLGAVANYSLNISFTAGASASSQAASDDLTR